MKGWTIAEHWESYAARVLPPDAPAEQRLQTRLAFYSGVSTIFMVMERIGEPDVSEDQGLDILAAIKAELESFVADQLKRRHRRGR